MVHDSRERHYLLGVVISTIVGLSTLGCSPRNSVKPAPETESNQKSQSLELEQLRTRVADLERRMLAQPPSTASYGRSSTPGTLNPSTSSPATAASHEAPVTSAQVQGPTGNNRTSIQTPSNSTPPKDPNPFDVGEDAEAQRALERTLVISGALLVPYGQFEVQPGFNYLHYANSSSILVNTTTHGLEAGNVSTNVNDMLGSAYLRMGLPWESQIETYIPYQSIQQQTTGNISGSIYASNAKSSSGLSDVRVSLAKTLMNEKDWWPDVIARIAWQSNTGQLINSIPLGTGYNDIIGSVTLTKRQDPLVFYGTFSYQSAIATTSSRPGQILGFTLGTILAASPETSLRAFLNQNFVSNTQYGGQWVNGSNMNISTLNLGASTVLGRGLFLDFTAGVGLTPQSPDYTVGTSLAYRFDMPFDANTKWFDD